MMCGQAEHDDAHFCLCRYILSVYWSITTLSTVGYGDWSPTTPFEMAFVVLYMLFVSTHTPCSQYASFLANSKHVIFHLA